MRKYFFESFLLGSWWRTQVLQRGEPYPQVILPQFGGYWIEDAEASGDVPSTKDPGTCNGQDGGGAGPEGGFGYRLERNSAARAYRKHFLGKVGHFMTTKLDVLHNFLFVITVLNSFDPSVWPLCFYN